MFVCVYAIFCACVVVKVDAHTSDTPHTQVLFKVSQAVASLLVFNASVWKGGVKLYDANPVTVSSRIIDASG